MAAGGVHAAGFTAMIITPTHQVGLGLSSAIVQITRPTDTQ
jgi:hypothetical protein